MSRNPSGALLLAGAAMLVPATAAAQTTAPADPAVTPAPIPANTGSKRIYTPADFARFAPKTAYDMLVQVPGFTIRVPQNGEVERGLGQANENVLINGQRIANKNYGGGDAGAVDELQRVSAANVDRIEIVEAASLGIAGLSGQVANVILKSEKKSSGQFEWNPDIRAHYSKPNLYQGSISYTSKTGPIDYTLRIKNDAGRGAFGGPILIYDANHDLIESRNEIFHSESELLTMSAKFGIDGPGSSVGNLLLAYTPYWGPVHIRDHRVRADGLDRSRFTSVKLDGWYYDVNADYEFALGPGRLKLIGLRHFDHEPTITKQITAFDAGGPDEGVRLTRDARISETIGRAEYGLKIGKNDIQLSLERAFNSLDQRGKLEELSPQGDFVGVPFPGGTGKVQETRYEAIASLSRPLTPNLDLQVAGGGEISKLERVDGDLPPRKFFRPKGSINLGWRPAKGWDASLKLRRKVGQISFYDFLEQPNLQQDRENAGNPDLVPPQSWEIEAEVGRELGDWGKTRLRTYYHLVTDIIDVIPIGDGGEGVGNLPHAKRFGMESTSTFLFDPIGWKGAKLDMTLGFERTRVRDPLTGEQRTISGIRDRWGSLELRHDVPGTSFAWGASANYDHFTTYYRLTEVFRSWEGPFWFGAFVEHKDIAGLTVRAEVSNIFNARHRNERTFYGGYRDISPITGYQSNNQLIGPIFELSVKGTF